MKAEQAFGHRICEASVAERTASVWNVGCGEGKGGVLQRGLCRFEHCGRNGRRPAAVSGGACSGLGSSDTQRGRAHMFWSEWLSEKFKNYRDRYPADWPGCSWRIQLREGRQHHAEDSAKLGAVRNRSRIL